MGRLYSLFSHTPLGRYINAVIKGTEEREEEIDNLVTVADINARRIQWLFYEQNHITPKVAMLLSGRRND